MIVVGTPVDDGGGGGGGGEEPRLRLSTVFVGANGSTWDLSGGGPVTLRAGTEFGDPDPEHWWKDSPALPGSSHQGQRDPRGDVFLPVVVQDDTSLGLRDLDSAFKRAVRTEGECQLIVTAPDAITRRMSMRYESGLNTTYDVADPLHLMWTMYGLRFSRDPYATGGVITATFTPEDAIDWLSTWPWSIGSSDTFETGTIPNPGDVPASPRWVINGPYTTATVGVGDALVTFDTAIGPGEQRIIDMNPRSTLITDEDGNDKWLDASDVAFADIPTGDATLTMSVAGLGSSTRIELALTPQYWSLW